MIDDRPYVDHARRILAGEPLLNDDQRSDLWDHYHGSANSAELAQRLHGADAPDEIKQQLFDAKKMSDAVDSPVDAATNALNKIKTLDPRVLELAESHPTVTKALLSGVTTKD